MEQETASARKFAWKEKMVALGSDFLTVGSFTGSGIVMSSTRVGVTYDFQLFWCVIFSVIAVIVVQGMSARLDIITQERLAENLESDFADRPLLRDLLCGLVAPAITIGDFAYMDRDLTEATFDIGALTGISTKTIAPVWGLCILLILSFAGDAVKYLEKLFGTYVVIMVVVSMMTMVIIRPGLGAMPTDCVPSIPENGGLMTCLPLTGAIVVPYNTLLHTASARRTWHSAEEPPLCNFGTILPMVVNGIITGSITVISAAAVHGMTVNNAMDVTIRLKPTLDALARPSMAIGPVAVGVSSAVHTPMGVSCVFADLFGRKTNGSDKRYVSMNAAVLTAGIVIAMLGTNLLGPTMMVQAVSGIVPPVVVGVTVYLTCREKAMG